MHLIDFGLADYCDMHAEQIRLVQARIDGNIPDTCLMGEHLPVYTAGKTRNNAVQDVKTEATIIAVERGGQVTYHGPGQLMVYPIRHLPPGQRDLHAVLRQMEGWLIDLLGHFNLYGFREPGWSGVWVRHPVTEQSVKIASIGLAVKRWVTYHGIALNVTTDLAAFQGIQPCGLQPDVMTSMQVLLSGLGRPVPDDLIAQVKQQLANVILYV